MKKRCAGVGLTEVFLVLAIAIAIILMGIRQYRSFRLDADVQQLKYNVDIIFQAMSDFYRANCLGIYNASNVLVPGLLNPSHSPAPTSPYPVDLTTVLVANGYLAANPFPLNPLVDNSNPPFGGYKAQFNQTAIAANNRQVCLVPTGTAPVTGPGASQNCKTPVTIGSIVTWSAQVSVLMKDQATAKQYLAMLGGDCLSNTGTNNTVSPCPTSGASISLGTGKGLYVVFQRQASFSSQAATPTQWLMNQTVTQFKQMYTTYPIVYLTNSNGQIQSGSGASVPQYYYCGQ